MFSNSLQGLKQKPSHRRNKEIPRGWGHMAQEAMFQKNSFARFTGYPGLTGAIFSFCQFGSCGHVSQRQSWIGKRLRKTACYKRQTVRCLSGLCEWPHLEILCRNTGDLVTWNSPMSFSGTGIPLPSCCEAGETLVSWGPQDLASFPSDYESKSLLWGALSVHGTEILTLAPASSHYTSPSSLPLFILIFQCGKPCPAQVLVIPSTCPQPTQVVIKEGLGKCRPITKSCLQAVCKLRTPLSILCSGSCGSLPIHLTRNTYYRQTTTNAAIEGFWGAKNESTSTEQILKHSEQKIQVTEHTWCHPFRSGSNKEKLNYNEVHIGD